MEMNIEQARINMVTQQVKTRDVTDPKVLEVISSTPREVFVPPQYKDFAFADLQLPLDANTSMLKPSEEAMILQALQIKPEDEILEIGTGTGYFTALLAKLGKYVYSVEYEADRCSHAAGLLSKLGLHNFSIQQGDAARGWDHHTPFNVIVITGSMPILPKRFKDALASGGRIVAILGEPPVMQAVLIYKKQAHWHEVPLFETLVPPLHNAMKKESFVF